MPKFFKYKDLDLIKLSKYIYLLFLNIINILSNSYFIEFYIKDKAISTNVLIFIKPKPKRTRLAIIINNKDFKVTSSINLKLVFIKGYKLLIIFSRGYKALTLSLLIIKEVIV